MPDFLQLVSALREQMNASLSRTDVLRPISWIIGITLTGFLAALAEKAPTWALATIGGLLVAQSVLYIFAYTYCLLNDRDALRSENYKLNKMAIEHGVFGDNSTGIIELSKEDDPQALPSPSSSEDQKGDGGK